MDIKSVKKFVVSSEKTSMRNQCADGYRLCSNLLTDSTM